MVEISLSGSGEGPGWVTAPGYSTAAFFAGRPIRGALSIPFGDHGGGAYRVGSGGTRMDQASAAAIHPRQRRQHEDQLEAQAASQPR